MNKKYYIYIICVFYATIVHGQNSKNTIQTDTITSIKNTKFIGLPIAFFTPETNFGFGGGGQLFLLNKTNKYNDRLSNILFSGIYTLNKQIQFEASPKIYLGNGDYFIDMRYFLNIFPNSFWGIGNNTPNTNEEAYNTTSHNIRIAFLKRLPPKLNFGFEYVFENHEVTEKKEDGILDISGILGNNRAVISGLGVIFNLDSRDATGSPLSGRYYKVNARFSSKLLGATDDFNKFIVDLRTYEKLSNRSTLAMQVYLENNYGNIPFQGLASFGGGNTARGYFKGRFIDAHMYIAQVEYRLRFKPRWTAAAYSLVGEVAQRPNDFFSAKNLKPAAGAGIRYKVIKDQDTWLRLDIGIGQDNSNGIYFGINEAF